MRRQLLFLAILISFTSLAFADPKIEVQETEWDFGHVPQQSTIKHDYLIRNIGDDTLRIVKVKPG